MVGVVATMLPPSDRARITRSGRRRPAPPRSATIRAACPTRSTNGTSASSTSRVSRRIGHDAAGAPGAATLAALHRAHLAAIPFENLDIPLGRGIAVDLESVQAKLVARRRGGYCYEHGLLFAAALERLGYPVDRFLARVGDDVVRPRGRTHMRCACGPATRRGSPTSASGRACSSPLPFGAGGPHPQGGWTFALAAAGPHAWELRERRAGEWTTAYRFDDVRQHPADVVVANHFTSTFPRSPFVGRAVAVRRDEDALRELIDRTLTTTRPDGSSEAREIGDGDLATTLRDVFGLELGADEIARLTDATATRA